MKPVTLSLWLALAASALILVGSLGPWSDTLGITEAGTEGDGVITLVLAIVAFASVLGAFSSGRIGLAIGAAVIGLLVLVIGIADFTSIEDTASLSRDLSEDADLLGALEIQANASELRSAAWGLYLVIVGGFGLLVGSAWLLRDLRNESPTASST